MCLPTAVFVFCFFFVRCIPLHIDESLAAIVTFLVLKLKRFVSFFPVVVLNCFSSC